MQSFVIKYIDISLTTSGTVIPHVLKGGWGKSIPGGKHNYNQNALFAYCSEPTLVKRHKTSFNGF